MPVSSAPLRLSELASTVQRQTGASRRGACLSALSANFNAAGAGTLQDITHRDTSWITGSKYVSVSDLSVCSTTTLRPTDNKHRFPPSVRFVMATEKDFKPGMLVGWTHRNDFVLGTIVETKRVNCIVRQMSDPSGSKLHKIDKLILESEIGAEDIQMAKAQGGRSACWEEGRDG